MPVLQRPAYLQSRAPSTLASVLSGGIGTAQPPRISLKDDRFTLIMPNGERHPQVQPSLTLDVVVVGGNPTASRMFYDARYDPNDAAAPVCWSDNGVGPSVNAATPQSETCAMCDHAIWKHINENGKKVPACSTIKKVAVLVPGGGETVFLLQIPPASLKPWRGFLAHLDTLGASIDEVIVRLSLADKTLGFEPVDFLPPNVFEFAQKIAASPEPDVVCGVKDKPRDMALPAPTPTFGIPAPQPQPAPNGVTQTTERTFTVPPAPAPQPVVETPEQREAREFAEFAEFKAAKARAEGQPAQPPQPAQFGGPQPGAVHQGDVQPPEPKQRALRGSKKQETVVGAGPIAAGTFSPPAASGFIGRGQANATPAGFGMAPPAQAGADIQNALAKAFNMPLG